MRCSETPRRPSRGTAGLGTGLPGAAVFRLAAPASRLEVRFLAETFCLRSVHGIDVDVVALCLQALHAGEVPLPPGRPMCSKPEAP